MKVTEADNWKNMEILTVIGKKLPEDIIRVVETFTRTMNSQFRCQRRSCQIARTLLFGKTNSFESKRTIGRV